MRTAWVRLTNRNYPIFIGRELLRDAGKLLKKHGLREKNVLVVSQPEIPSHLQHTLSDSLTREGFDPHYFLTPASKNSETTKSQAVFQKLLKRMAATDGSNKSLAVIALGGGVVGDLAGFAASVYRRGIPYIQIPTTLTAQVDSAIGGKTAIDLPEGKNLLGTIYQPVMVISDPSVLESLPDRRWSDGFAEVIKYGAIKDQGLFKLLERKGFQGIRGNARHLEDVIFRCAKIKSKLVEKDELDKKGFRMILNFGHTTGHAIEAAAGFSTRYTHGESVGIGMLVACDIAKQMNILKESGLAERLESLLIKFNLPTFYKALTVEALLKAMGYDKKAEGGVNRFVLPITLANVTIVRDVSQDVIREALLRRKH